MFDSTSAVRRRVMEQPLTGTMGAPWLSKLRVLAIASIAPLALGANPDLTEHRTSPRPVPWEVGEPQVNLNVLGQKLVSQGMRATDIELDQYFNSFGNPTLSSLNYTSIDVENTGPYEMSTVTLVGPAPVGTVITALQDLNLRPIDIEYNHLNDPPVMTATAVSNRGIDAPSWFIQTGMSAQSIDDLHQGFPVQYRPIDIEFAGYEGQGPDEHRVYAVLAYENSNNVSTGATQWWVGFDMTPFTLLVNQSQDRRILDLEIHSGRGASSPRWDAIFIPWDEDGPVYNHVLSLVSPTYADPQNRSSIPSSFTDDFAPETNDFIYDVPGLSAGYRITDRESYFTNGSFNSTSIRVDGTFVDAPTHIQAMARDEFEASATQGPLDSVERCGFVMSEIGAPSKLSVHAIHPLGRPESTTQSRLSVPAHLPFVAAYAVLNDDLDLTEQQLNTCDPGMCVPPTNLCDPRLFTIREMLERMRDLGDYSAARTLVEERYLETNVEDFIQQISHTEPCSSNCDELIAHEVQNDPTRYYCDAEVSMRDLTRLIERMTDGTLGDTQTRADFLEYMYSPAPQALNDQIDALIDDEALEVDLTPSQIQQFKDATTRLWRTISVDTTSTLPGDPNTPVTRRASFGFFGIPFFDEQSGEITQTELSINAFLESLADDPTPLHTVSTRALRDAIADALDTWSRMPSNCNEADLAEPFGLLDLADVVAFITAFSGGDPAGDLVPDGLFDLADVVAFITAFSEGCP